MAPALQEGDHDVIGEKGRGVAMGHDVQGKRVEGMERGRGGKENERLRQKF